MKMNVGTTDWSRVRLGDLLLAIEAGKNFRCVEKPPEDDAPGVVKVSAVTWGSFDESESKTCPNEALFDERRRILPGDFLISRANTRELVGACVVVGVVTKRLMLSDKILRLVLPEEIKRWVLWYLRSGDGRVQIEARASGNQQSMRNIGQDAIRSIAIPVAPTEERQRVVGALESHLSRLDDATATLERIQRNLQRYRASVLKAAVEGRLVPTEAELARAEGRSYEPASVLLERILAERRRRWEESGLAKMKASGKAPKDDHWKARYEPPQPPRADLQDLPEGWCWATVDQLSVEVRYGSSARTEGGLAGGVPVIRMGNIVDGLLDFGDLKYLPEDHDEFPDLLLEQGDLLFNRTNSAELVGKSAVFTGYPGPCSFASYLIRVRFAEEIQPKYVAQYINSAAGRSWIASVVSQQVGQANVNGTKLRACVLPLPPASEQCRIVAESDRLLSLDAHLAATVPAERQRCGQLRQTILRWAFEGRLVDQDPTDEPASVLLDRIRSERVGIANGGARNNAGSRRRAVRQSPAEEPAK